MVDIYGKRMDPKSARNKWKNFLFWKMRLWRVNDFEITSKSPISSKPSALRVEGLEGLKVWRFGREKSDFMLERNGLLE